MGKPLKDVAARRGFLHFSELEDFKKFLQNKHFKLEEPLAHAKEVIRASKVFGSRGKQTKVYALIYNSWNTKQFLNSYGEGLRQIKKFKRQQQQLPSSTEESTDV